MSQKTISVVLATCNGSRYLAEQLDSLCEQTVPPTEIVISDDASDDDTVEIVKKIFVKSRADVRIIENETRLGYRENFLRAALETRGDFIAFCDQDDVWRADKIERCSAFLDDPGISLITHPATTIDRFSKRIGEFRQGIKGTRIKPPLSYDLWSTFWGFSIVFRRELLYLSPIQERFIDYIDPLHLAAHDRWISFLGQMVGSTAEIDECLVAYRQHENNLFGASGSDDDPSQIGNQDRSSIYIDATSGMLSIINNISAETHTHFPLYDEERCLSFLKLALGQLEARHRIYVMDHRLDALKTFCRMMAQGKYKNVHDGKMRWRSAIRDLKFIASRS